jgi:DNA polymerase-3 subunit delta'
MSPLAPQSLGQVMEAVGQGTGDDSLLSRAGGSVRNAILLSQYGGLEIAGALENLVRSARYEIGAAHKLADVVAGRDGAVPFDIFNRHALDLLSEEARQAALAGDLARAKSLTDAWQEARDAVIEMETYNLDKKQHALSMIDRLNSAFRM